MLNLYPLYAVSIAVFVSFRFLTIFSFFMPSPFLKGQVEGEVTEYLTPGSETRPQLTKS